MFSQTRKELLGLETKLKKEIECVLEERRELGLGVPETYNVRITYYNNRSALAQAGLREEGPEISLNLLPSLFDFLTSENQEKAGEVMRYFDDFRTIFPMSDEELIINITENPSDFFDRVEKGIFFTPDHLSYLKKHLAETGKTYEEYKKGIISKGKSVLAYLSGLIPILTANFERIDSSSLRHEMDHAVFYASAIYTNYIAMKKRVSELQTKLHVNQDASVAMELAEAQKQLRPLYVEANILLESRANFFNHIPYGEMNKSSASKVVEVVSSLENYIYGPLLIPVLDSLMSVAWSEGRMDRQTSNYIFRYVCHLAREDSTRYAIDISQVNFTNALFVLNELSVWIDRMEKYTNTAVKTMTKAFASGRADVLYKAQSANSFEEYISLCNQGMEKTATIKNPLV
jgi:hypothetical protein